MLALVLVHGVFWSGLLSASRAYMTNLLPESRRAEGIGYWGLSTLAAMAVAPTDRLLDLSTGGWLWLCLGDGGAQPRRWRVIALAAGTSASRRSREALRGAGCSSGVSRRSRVTLALYSFGYGGITSFTACTPTRTGSRRRAST